MASCRRIRAAGRRTSRGGRPLALLVPLLILLTLAVAAPAQAAETFVTTRITNNALDDRYPEVSGDRLVWDGDEEVYTWTPASGVVRLTNNAEPDTDPQVSGDQVVWNGYTAIDPDSSRSDIYSWTPAGGTVLLTGNYGEDDFYTGWDPQVSGDRVVWWGYHSYDAFPGIFTFPGPVPIQIDAGVSHLDVDPPQVSGDRVVWASTDEYVDLLGETFDLYTWTPTGGVVRLTDNPYRDSGYHVSGDRVVWLQTVGTIPDATFDLYTWTPTGGGALLATDVVPYDPQVSGDRVVWVDKGAESAEIYTWTPAGGAVRITNNDRSDNEPQISGDRLVWNRSYSGHDEVYTWTPAGGTTRLTSNISDTEQAPKVSGDRVVWMTWLGASYIDGTYEIHTAVPAAAAPTITGLNPKSGPAAGGNQVIITGANFVGVTDVYFDTTNLADGPSFTVDSPTLITATAPQHVPGTVRVRVVTAAGGSTADTAADDYTYESLTPYTSLRGSDRYDTAIKISQAMFPGALSAGAGLVVAPGETFPEALCGAPLAAAYGGPVLLTYKTALANNVKTELQRLLPTQVFCIGMSTTAVNQVRTALPTATVTAIGGATVYEMSRNVANALKTKVNLLGGAISQATAIITLGTTFPDAIGVSPLACAQLWPIILTNKADGSALHTSAQGALTDLGITKALKVGTYALLPGAVSGVGNCSGTDRYQTNQKVAQWAKDNAGLAFAHIGITTGDKFPDALASGPYLAEDQGILLLSPLTGPLPPVIATLITANQATVQHVTFIAMIEPVIGQVKALLP